MSGFAKRAARKRGALVTSATTARVLHGQVETGGAHLSESQVAARVGWLAGLVSYMSARQLRSVWSNRGFDEFEASDSEGYAYKAVGAAFGLPGPPAGVHVSSRVQRMAGAVVGETLRAGLHRRIVALGVLESQAGGRVWADVPGTPVEKRNTSRQINRHITATGITPRSFFTLAPAPPARTSPVVGLAAAGDSQIATWLSPTDNRLRLRVLLPTRARPKKCHWAWCVLTVAVDPAVLTAHLAGRVLLTLPTLKVSRGKILAHITIDTLAPKAPAADPNRVFALDWGVGRLLTGAVVTQHPDGTLSTDGRMYVFDASAWFAKDHHRRHTAERLRAKIARVTHLLDGQPVPDPALVAKVQMWTAEEEAVGAARARANKELARLAGRWALAHAGAVGAGVIAAEDLASMEPKFHQRLRVNLSQRLRGLLAETFTLLCSKEGVRFEPVDPAHTSAHCWGCAGNVTHRRASNDSRAGYRWAWCSTCNTGRDRDWVAAVNIGARALRTPGSASIRRKGGDRHDVPPTDLGDVAVIRTKRPKRAPAPRTSAVHNPSHPVRSRPDPAPDGATPKPPRRSTSTVQRSRVHRGTTPPQPGARPDVLRVVHRSVGTGHETVGSDAGSQAGDTFSNVHNPHTIRVRAVDGMRYAHRHRIRCTPVRVPASLNPHTERV